MRAFKVYTPNKGLCLLAENSRLPLFILSAAAEKAVQVNTETFTVLHQERYSHLLGTLNDFLSLVEIGGIGSQGKKGKRAYFNSGLAVAIYVV
jgi:hypothetical protein